MVREQSFIDGGKVNLYSYVKINVVVPQEDGIHLPQNTAITFLGIYPKDMLSYHGDTCSAMFVAALFITDGN